MTSPADAALQPCQDDQDCSRGYTCTGGYCLSPTPVDAGPDVPQAPKMMVSPTLLDFGNVYPGVDYPLTFAIANVGNSTLNVTAMDLVEDTTVGAFTVQSKPLPMAIEVGASDTLTVVLHLNDNNLPLGRIIIHSNDPDATTGSATVELVSHSKGSPFLSVCSNNPQPPPDCQVDTDGSAVIDFGAVPYGSTVTRLVDLRNNGDGNLPLQITGVALSNPTHFSLVVFELIEDPLNPGQTLERQLTFPFLLSAGDPTATPPVVPTVIRAHVGFSAVGIDGLVPNIQLVVSVKDNMPTGVPVKGTILGCVPVATDAGMPDGGADPQTDPNNCGTCGHKCTVAHGTPGCANGQCTVAACDSGWLDCDGNSDNGCEINRLTDADNCGACLEVCSNNHVDQRSCVNGNCESPCSSGYADCDGNKQTNGCESQLAMDPNNCGGCGVVCSSANMATRTCNANVCDGTCASGWSDCNTNKQLDGCEIHTDLDTNNCGSCGNKCGVNTSYPNVATYTCSSGVCAVADCKSGWYNFDAATNSDGCECQDLSSGNHTCGLGTLGTIDDTGQTASLPGTLPYAGAVAWFVVVANNSRYNSYGPPWYTNPFNLKIGFAVNPSDHFQLQVYGDCAQNPATCPEGSAGSPIHLTMPADQWDASPANPCWPSNQAGYNLCENLGRTLYIQVTRRAGSPSCEQFTVQATNGL